MAIMEGPPAGVWVVDMRREDERDGLYRGEIGAQVHYVLYGVEWILWIMVDD